VIVGQGLGEGRVLEGGGEKKDTGGGKEGAPRE